MLDEGLEVRVGGPDWRNSEDEYLVRGHELISKVGYGFFNADVFHAASYLRIKDWLEVKGKSVSN